MVTLSSKQLVLAIVLIPQPSFLPSFFGKACKRARNRSRLPFGPHLKCDSSVNRRHSREEFRIAIRAKRQPDMKGLLVAVKPEFCRQMHAE